MALTEILRSISILFVFVVPATVIELVRIVTGYLFRQALLHSNRYSLKYQNYISALYFTGFHVNNNQPIDVTSFAKQVRDHSFSTFAKCTA